MAVAHEETMTRICQKCRRANPLEARYCYHDGVLFDNPSGGAIPGAGGAINVGGRPFTVPFVFPSGRACGNFHQLAMACHEERAAILDLLGKGPLEAFLAGQERADLAEAARRAARAGNRERGLDDFLGSLPASLAPAKLGVEPPVLDLGTLRMGEDRHIQLVLRNEGLRLLYGSASCEDTPWLSLGSATGPALKRKLFQLSDRAVLPIRVLGRHFRAYPKPQDAEIRLESNGGTATVTVRIQVPVQPFPEGMLAGVLSPRQLVEKAHQELKEATALIVSGAVARWYQANGWKYPVTGPTARGLAAVQQLFEALGVATPPRVELSEDAIQLGGCPGQAIEYVLAVVTQENRPAVAYGTSDQPWLRIGPTIYHGRTAMVPLIIAAVPGLPGETLRAAVSITANGAQRLVVPVTLVVEGPAKPLPAAATPPPAKNKVTHWKPLWRTLLPLGMLAVILLGGVLYYYLTR